MPNRPVAGFAVDRSNYRIAYVAYNGYDEATPKTPGHVFATTDGGQSWTNISGDLPDAPVNSIVLDPAFPNTLYAGTDVGPFVTYDGGAHWSQLGTGMPTVAIWQLDMDPLHRIIAAGSHGRGAFRLADTTTPPALVVSKVDAGVPVGPSSTLNYTITLRNIGNAAGHRHHDHRSDPRQHELRLSEQRRHGQQRDGHVVRPDRWPPGRAPR